MNLPERLTMGALIAVHVATMLGGIVALSVTQW